MKDLAISILFLLTLLVSSKVYADIINCASAPNFDFNKMLDQLSAGVSKTTLKDGFYQTSYNLKIDADCTSRMKIADLEKFYRNTMAEGTACLDRLTKSGVGNLGSVNNACLMKLFEDKTNPPKLLCGGWPFGKEIFAVGSFPGSSKRHPYLWLGTEIVKLYKAKPLELKATIFHEMLHNCGFTHSEGMEIAYTCEQCCFADDITKDQKQSACNICGGKYSSEADPKYIAELFQWSRPYPNWSNDMRQQVYLTALNTKKSSTFILLLDEIKVQAEQKEMLLKIFEEKNLENKKTLLSEFKVKNQDELSKKLPLKSLIEWMNR
jgi:hypothetical protein